MSNFVILFNGKEGTSPLVRLLANFDKISLVHQVGDKGWEPFEKPRCGPMPTRNLIQCLDYIFQPDLVLCPIYNFNKSLDFF